MSKKKAKNALTALLIEKLAADLNSLPVKLSDKKTKRNIRKASKVLLAGARIHTAETETPLLPAPVAS